MAIKLYHVVHRAPIVVLGLLIQPVVKLEAFQLSDDFLGCLSLGSIPAKLRRYTHLYLKELPLVSISAVIWAQWVLQQVEVILELGYQKDIEFR